MQKSQVPFKGCCLEVHCLKYQKHYPASNKNISHFVRRKQDNAVKNPYISTYLL